jgi:hypothetical protein
MILQPVIKKYIRYTPQQVDKNCALEIENEDESLNTGLIEDTIDIPLIVLKELIPTDRYNNIVEIWELVHHRCTKKNYVVLFDNKSHLCTCLGLVRCGIVCHHFFHLLGNSMYAKFHVMLISKRWYNDEKQREPTSILCQQPFTDGFQEPSVNTLQTETFLEMPYKMVNIPYEHVYNSLNQRKEYATANGLSKKAIQLGLDVGSLAIQELNDFMKNFITKHTPNQKSPRRNPRALLAKSYNIPDSSDESDGFDSSDSNYDNDELDSQDIKNINPSLIQNPIVHTRKGAPRKARFKGSHEVKQKNAERQKNKGRKPTECQQCHKVGHNKAGCEKWHQKNQIPYSF